MRMRARASAPPCVRAAATGRAAPAPESRGPIGREVRSGQVYYSAEV